MSRNLNEGASKETLAQSVSLSLKKPLTKRNIKKGFSGTGIWLLNELAVDSMLRQSQPFQLPAEEVPEGGSGVQGGWATVWQLGAGGPCTGRGGLATV